jgi:betaine-aldehyde dehydrogenase
VLNVMEGKMLINGKLTESESGRWIDCISPASEQVIGKIPKASAADVNAAVEAAEKAFPAWEMLGIDGRAKYLNRLADKITECVEELAVIEAMDTGHTLGRVRVDIHSAANFLRFYAGLGWELKGETIPATPDNYHMTVREPYGVVAKIVPFNHPVMFASRIGAPLIAGNTVILKAPREASLSICRFASLCGEVFPAGVVNIITGSGDEAGDTLVRHPRIKRIGFIGAEKTGLDIKTYDNNR